MPDPLATVLRIRRVTVDEARRGLGEALRAADKALEQAEVADKAISEEGEIAADLAAGDNAVEAFAAWLPVGRARAQAAHERCVHAQSEVAKARAALTVARAAAEAADALLQRRRADAATQVARRDQADMDEVAGRITAPANP